MTTAKNLIWTGENDPPEYINDGRERLELPSPATCREGFHSSFPERLILLTGGQFKRFVEKGDDAIARGVSRGRKLTQRGKL